MEAAEPAPGTPAPATPALGTPAPATPAPRTPPSRRGGRAAASEDPVTPPRSKAARRTPGAPRAVPPRWSRPPPPEALELREVHVTGLGGPLCSIAAKLTWRPDKLKAAVERVTGIPALEQVLIVGTCELDDDQPLLQGLAGGCHVTLVRRAPEAARRLRRASEALWTELGELLEAELSEAAGGDLSAILALVQRDGRLLERLPEAIRANRRIVLAAVRRHPDALAHAVDALRADREVVQAAALRCPFALQHAHQALRSDRHFVAEVMQGEDQVERLLTHPKEVVLWARCSLSCAAPALQQDPHLRQVAGLTPAPAPSGDGGPGTPLRALTAASKRFYGWSEMRPRSRSRSRSRSPLPARAQSPRAPWRR